MNRLEELTVKMLDDRITDREEEELQTLIAGDDAAAHVHLSQLKAEAALRRRGKRKVDAASAVMAHITARQDRVVDEVMAHARRESSRAQWPSAARPASLFRSWWLLGAVPLLAGAAAVVVLIARPVRAPQPRVSTTAAPRTAPALRLSQAPGPAESAWSVLTSQGKVTVTRDKEARPADIGTVLQIGDQLQTSSDGLLVIGEAGSLRIEIAADSVVVLDGVVADHGKGPPAALNAGQTGPAFFVIRLERGAVVASSAPAPEGRPIAVVTSLARANVVTGTRLALVATESSTALDAHQGRVTFDRLLDGTAGELGTGESTVVSRQVKPETGGRVLLSFDFEDGQAPKGTEHGLPVASCPSRPGNKFCFIAELAKNTLGRSAVSIEGPGWGKGLFEYSETLVLSFDYWVGAGADDLAVLMWSQELGDNFRIMAEKPVTDSWAHAELRLKDLFTWDKKVRPLRAMDRLENILILSMSRRGPGVPLFIDNLELTDREGKAFPAASNWNVRRP